MFCPESQPFFIHPTFHPLGHFKSGGPRENGNDKCDHEQWYPDENEDCDEPDHRFLLVGLSGIMFFSECHEQVSNVSIWIGVYLWSQSWPKLV
jgi:hypothetical protein